MSTAQKVLLRFDASKEIGVGHAMRCLTLGEELAQRGVVVEIVSQSITSLVSERAARLKVPIHSFPEDFLADEFLFTSLSDHDFVIVDGYQFKQDFFDRLDQSGGKYATIVDCVEQIRGTPRLLINPNPGAEAKDYLSARIEFVAVGLAYAILRPELRRKIGSIPPFELTSRPSVLVSIGGTDSGDIGPKIAGFLADTGDFHVFLSGPSCPPGIERAPTEIAELFGRLSYAVVGAGTSMIELAYCGIPSVGLVVADNQMINVPWASRQPSLRVLDARSGISLDQILRVIREFFENGDAGKKFSQTRDLPDGLGVARIVDLVMKCLPR